MIGFVLALGSVIFGVRMNNWQSRQRMTRTNDGEHPRESILGHFMLTAVMLACHTFVLLFFSFQFLVSAYWLVFYRMQHDVFLLLPSDDEFSRATNEYLFFDISIRILFWFQTLWIMYTIVQQCCCSDIFFVDWEQPKRGKTSNDIPMWRLLTVAKEYNKKMAKRKTNVEFTLLFVGLMLLGFNQNANSVPQPTLSSHYDGNDNKSNIVLEFANVVIFWITAAVIQYVWNFLIYERYITEPPQQKLLDLCAVCNVSILIMVEQNKGFYLHGRSPYPSDCGLEEMLTNLRREGKMLDRGLEGANGCQAFDFFASAAFRHQMNKIYSYARPARNGFRRSRDDENGDNHEEEKTAMARAELTRFLQSFVDRQPHPSKLDGLRFLIHEPFLAERLLSTTPAEFRSTTEQCILVPDDKNGYLQATFLGIEYDLLIHDILTYMCVSMAFGHNAALSLFLTYTMHLLRSFVRSWWGEKNLCNKSMISPRFLG